MSTEGPRMPPRFIPTLTEVVELTEVQQQPMLIQPPAALPQAAMTTAPLQADAAPILGTLPADLGVALQDELTRRVLDRVALALEPVLADTIAAVARQHSHAMTQHLAETVEDTVAALVAEAVEAEMIALRERGAPLS